MHTALAEGLSNPRDSDNLSELNHNMEEKEEDGNIGVGYAATSINENGGIQGNVRLKRWKKQLNDNGHPRSVQEMEEIVRSLCFTTFV
uniref:Uncharacterized protein n=1 Tax=Tanacetum cinerariifolium TaxID=118510 RepID=A0A699KM79_TANCI|nr:hypothetical protein [Tanacetum cinerariifolium]